MAEDIRYSSRLDNKRKFDDQGGATSPSSTTSSSGRKTTGFSAPIISPTSAVPALSTYNNVPPPPDGIELAKKRAQEIAARLFSVAEAKRPRIESDGVADDWSNKGFSSDQSLKPMGQSIAFQLGGTNSTSSSHGFSGASKKIEIPNGRVGVIIGRSGETIKYLQVQSGARIQITRDVDADPGSQTRSVEIFGSPEQISKAEQLVNEVISEAEVGGSGSVSARNFTPFPTNTEHFSMKVPNNKVGLLIGKGGENIKNMQATCGARIQVIPLHLLPGDPSIERTVQIDGTKEQIELAKQLVNDVIISENRARIPQTGGYRPSRPPTSWVPSGAPQIQQPSYGYMQPGAYPGPAPQYSMPQPPYVGYPPPAQQTTQATGYDYYNHQQPPPPPEGNNINYNQMPTAYNGQATYGDSTYSQSAVGYQQSYGQQQAGDYNQAGPPVGYGQPISNPPPAGYTHQSYSPAPAYGNTAPSAQDGANPNYGVESSTQQAPLGQQPTTLSQPGYVASQPPASQTGYAQPAYDHSGQGYGQDSRQFVPGYVSGVPQAGFGQQQSYAGASAGTPTTSVEPAAINGVTKASHQS